MLRTNDDTDTQAPTGEHAVDVGVVVIGRNEGERLRRCLESVRLCCDRIVYVDSGSTDSSVAIARSMQLEVLALDPASPFSAARARNEGFAHLLRQDQAPRYVQFIDGDCTLVAGWLDAAMAVLNESPDCAAVIGHLKERYPEQSPYNRLCALEWKSPPGDLTHFSALGGIFLMRVEVFQRLGGFNPNVIAGEDSELGVRMALAGYKVTKIDHPMALHDANIVRFSQWWRRAMRSGHAIGQRADLHGRSILKDCIRERNSTWFWGIGLPMFIAITAVRSHGISLLLLGGYPLLALRVYHHRRRRGDTPADARLYSVFIILGRFAEAIGLLKFYWNRMRRRYRIIEYK